MRTEITKIPTLSQTLISSTFKPTYCISKEFINPSINPVKPATESKDLNLEVTNKIKVTDKNDTEEVIKRGKRLRNGRWTKAECKLFEEALKKFGRHWKKVEAYVGTRSGTQIRSHAQKYFLRVNELSHKGAAAVDAHDPELSATPSTFVDPNQEKNVPDTKNERKKKTNTEVEDHKNELSIQKLPQLQSAFKPIFEETSLGIFPESSEQKINKIIQFKYLLGYMQSFGFNSIEEIYSKYAKLSDWVQH